jgi:hypothetical protein
MFYIMFSIPNLQKPHCIPITKTVWWTKFLREFNENS